MERVSKVPVCSILAVLPGRRVQGGKFSPSDPGGSAGLGERATVQFSIPDIGQALLGFVPLWQKIPALIRCYLFCCHLGGMCRVCCRAIAPTSSTLVGVAGKLEMGVVVVWDNQFFFSLVTGMSATGADVKIWGLLTGRGTGYIIGGHRGHLRGCLCSAVWKGGCYTSVVWVTFLPHTRCVGIQEGAFIFLGSSALHSSDGTKSDFQVVRLGRNKFGVGGGVGGQCLDWPWSCCEGNNCYGWWWIN